MDEMEALQAQLEKNLGLGQRLIDKPAKQTPKADVPVLVVAEGQTQVKPVKPVKTPGLAIVKAIVDKNKKLKPKSEINAASARAMKSRNPDGTKKPRIPTLKTKGPDEAALLKKYPHAKAGTLYYQPAAKKWTIEIACAKCKAARMVHTSDLFQVKLCVACKGAKPTKQTVSTEQKAKNIEALAKEILG
jgi:hypothetical protein